MPSHVDRLTHLPGPSHQPTSLPAQGSPVSPFPPSTRQIPREDGEKKEQLIKFSLPPLTAIFSTNEEFEILLTKTQLSKFQHGPPHLLSPTSPTRTITPSWAVTRADFPKLVLRKEESSPISPWAPTPPALWQTQDVEEICVVPSPSFFDYGSDIAEDGATL